MPDSGAGSPGGGRTDVAAFCNGTFRHEDSPAPQHEMFRSAAAVSEPKSALNITYWICSRKVLKIPLTAGGASVASYRATPPRRMVMLHGAGGSMASRRRKRAGRGYMLPLARAGQGLAFAARNMPPVPEQNHTLRATLPTWFYGCMASEHLAHEKLHGVAQGEAPLRRRRCTPQFRCRVQRRRRRETCGPEHRIWPQLFSYAKCSRPRRAFPDPRG